VRFPRLPPSIAVIAVLALTLSMGEAHAGGFKPARARAKVFSFVNHYRVDHGMRRLHQSRDINRVARHHSQRMASSRKLFHSSSLSTKLRSKHPSCWGENIGMGPSVWRVFKGWVRSSAHRANMLNRHYRRTGIGVARGHGYLWVTMIYYG
jgi:uncharacterized protein YkwD